MTLRILFLIAASFIVVFHVASAVVIKKIAEILVYVNLGLHIVMFCLLMMLDVSLEFLALVFMVSLLIYLLSFLISRKVKNAWSARVMRLRRRTYDV